MKNVLLVTLAVCLTSMIMGWKNSSDHFEKITVREFELVDSKGTVRASIKVEEEGEVVFRLKDQSGQIRVKLGGGLKGSGLVLLDEDTEPGVHLLSKKGGTRVSVLDTQGKPYSIWPLRVSGKK